MIECFKIQLLQFDDAADVYELSSGRPIYTVPCLRPYLKSEPTIIEADPFLFVHQDRLYLFYESKPWLSPGVIKMVSTTDLHHWTKPVTVLQEPFHLSFPWVFEEDGHIYMIPETEASHSIRLYEAVDKRLEKFRLVKNLLVDREAEKWKTDYCDTAIVKKGNLYYLFTTRRNKEGVNVLELYTSEKITGDYVPHKCSPIQLNNKLGRNAGSLMIDGETIYRFSQDCTNRYGDNVHVSKIIKLTPTEYEETLWRENIIPTNRPFYRQGGHQFNCVRFKDLWIVATDAKEYHKMYLHRFVDKAVRMFGK